MTLAVGDTVSAPDYFCTGKVIGLHEHWVWVQLPDSNTPLTFNRDSLEIVERLDKAA